MCCVWIIQHVSHYIETFWYSCSVAHFIVLEKPQTEHNVQRIENYMYEHNIMEMNHPFQQAHKHTHIHNIYTGIYIHNMINNAKFCR